MTPPRPPLLVPRGTQIVTRTACARPGGGNELPAGSVGVVIGMPMDATHAYRVEFADGTVVALRRTEFGIWRREKADAGEPAPSDDFDAYTPYIAYRCVVGSRAYGLATETSDTDRRGFYLPPADLHWSLYGVPDQIERDATQECYWEIGALVRFALKANPNVLEVLWSPVVEVATPVADDLRTVRGAFLSRFVYQTYNGYALSQFRKLEQDLRARGEIRWKHAMHLVRLLVSGIAVLRHGEVRVDVGDDRERLLSIRRGEMPWEDVDRWRLALHHEFEEAFARTSLPERPDYETVNAFLIRARRSAL